MYIPQQLSKSLLFLTILFSIYTFFVNDSQVQAQNSTPVSALYSLELNSLQKDSLHHHFLHPSPQLNKKRLIPLSIGAATGYSAALYGLSRYWYSQFEKSPFHFYNDNAEWNQMDKVGHVYTAYAESWSMYHLYHWTGMKRHKAIYMGAALGTLYQTSIEVLDGYSSRWGASPGDLLANTLGVALMTGQELLWEEQRIQLKFSSHRVNYEDFEPLVQERAQDLYGKTWSERVLKDYNGQTYWLSFNPFRFKKNSRFPKWLQCSVGYGAQQLLGGFENEWTIEDGSGTTITTINRQNIPRIRQYYLALDIDLSQIHTSSVWLNLLFDFLSIVKFPAPTLEWNSEGRLRFYPIYF